MRTYPHPAGGWAGALRLLAGLALWWLCPSRAPAQQRKYLVELGVAGGVSVFRRCDRARAARRAGRPPRCLAPAQFLARGRGRLREAKEPRPRDEGVSVKSFGVSALYNFLIGARNSVYLKAGRGHDQVRQRLSRRGRAPICGSSGALLGGVGVRVGVTPTVMIRAEGSTTATRASRRPATPATLVQLRHQRRREPHARAASRSPTADGDGVLDNRDRCADTRPGARSTAAAAQRQRQRRRARWRGPLPTTVAGAAVDARAAPRTSDGDNIADGLDRCPDTPAGVLVDPRGCPKDSDGDKIPDGLDRCSETPRGATVDALGCPGDEDGDGVLDGLDRCPRTRPVRR